VEGEWIKRGAPGMPPSTMLRMVPLPLRVRRIGGRCAAYVQATIGGIEDRIVSMFPPALSPNMVPRS